MAARSMPRWQPHAPPPPQRSPKAELGFVGAWTAQRRLRRITDASVAGTHCPRPLAVQGKANGIKGRSAGSGPSPFTLPFLRRRISADVGDALLGLRLGRGRGLRGKLQHGCLLTFDEFGQENGLPIRKLERIVVHPRLVLVDLPEDRGPVGHLARAQPEESGCGACHLPGKRKLSPRKHAYRGRCIFLGGKSTGAGTKVARRQFVANSCSTRLHIMQAVVAHGEDSSFKPPVRALR